MNYFIGLDTSTTATKALLIDETGQVIKVASSEYPYQTPRPLWSEQDPELWWTAAFESIAKLLKRSKIASSDVKGLGLTGQMHGLVLLDEGGRVLRPAILWNDQRTAAECNEIRAILGKKRLIQITGNDALTGFTAPKILWVKNNQPALYRKVQHILLPKDYLRFKLTGIYASDRAGGAGTILFDLEKRDWSPEVLAALDINPDWLPPTYEGTQVTGTISPEAAKVTGLRPGTPVSGVEGTSLPLQSVRVPYRKVLFP